ncbi:cytochrome c oxidase assembly protein [Rhizobium sp. TH2]|uniref:cytochrome c oxidase assembly protein n=1 Tax=Rhizobium sp. TH2 TaxID=2775403 RepID=UPI002158796C|nr:cytochrome c oxidase assembly protein [Rhizobium sp. TH2]
MTRASLAAGILVLLAAWLLAAGGERSFAVHMVAHMAVVAIAAPLTAIGLHGTRLDFFPALTWITPLTASFIELIAVWFWHLPQIRLLADQSPVAANLEQATFLAAGLLLWLSCLSASRLAGAGGLLFTSMHMTLLGVLLAMSPRPLYATGQVICFSVPISAAVDQQVGGVAMLLVGAISYLAGGVALLYRLLADSNETGEQAG